MQTLILMNYIIIYLILTMAVKKVFWENPYQTELLTKVNSVQGNIITLFETIAFAFSGGQQSDDGEINGFKIINARKNG